MTISSWFTVATTPCAIFRITTAAPAAAAKAHVVFARTSLFACAVAACAVQCRACVRACKSRGKLRKKPSAKRFVIPQPASEKKRERERERERER
jgi:sugar (pentulose or hexulose) kinase